MREETKQELGCTVSPEDKELDFTLVDMSDIRAGQQEFDTQVSCSGCGICCGDCSVDGGCGICCGRCTSPSTGHSGSLEP